MDIGQFRISLENESLKLSGEPFGRGKHDKILGTEEISRDEWHEFASRTLDIDPDAWASLVRASLLVVQGSEDQQELLRNLNRLGAIVVAWSEDVNNRTAVGVDL